MIYDAKISLTVSIHPKHLTTSLDDKIIKQITNKIENKSLGDDGLVLNIINIENPIGGNIHYDTGYSLFSSVVKVQLYKPVVGEIITNKVIEANPSGFFTTDNRSRIFVAYSCQKRNVMQCLNNIVKVQITKCKYDDKKTEFMVIGKLIEN